MTKKINMDYSTLSEAEKKIYEEYEDSLQEAYDKLKDKKILQLEYLEQRVIDIKEAKDALKIIKENYDEEVQNVTYDLLYERDQKLKELHSSKNLEEIEK